MLTGRHARCTPHWAMHTASIPAALWALIALTSAACTDDVGPTMDTPPLWVDPVISGVGIEWIVPSHDCGFVSHDCDQFVSFAVTHVECDGCVLGADTNFTRPVAADDTLHDEGFGFAGIPFGGGPITITAVVTNTRTGDRTLTATTVGDRVSGLRTECWTATPDPTVFPPLGTPCGATRAPGDVVYIVPIAQTVEHGDFPVEDVGEDPVQTTTGQTIQGHYFRRLEVTPASLLRSRILTSPRTGADAFTLPADTTTTEVSFRWQLVLGGEVTATAAIPPLAP
jgi:hypothetical protein